MGCPLIRPNSLISTRFLSIRGELSGSPITDERTFTGETIMSKDSHNATAQQLNSNQTETEQMHHVCRNYVNCGEWVGDSDEFCDNCLDELEDEPKSEREILAAMVSELLVECIRVSGEGEYWVSCDFGASTDGVYVRVENPVDEFDIAEGLFREHFYLTDHDAADKLRSLIARVSALGAES